MKTWQKVFFFGLIPTIVIIIGVMLIPLLSNAPWWIFWLVFGLFALGWILTGGIFLAIKLNKKPPVKLKIDLKDAKNRAIYEMKYDNDNPDNFKINHSKLVRIGERGAEKTPIAVFYGVGTELNQERIIIINLNNPKQESTSLVDPTEKELNEAIRLIAEHPPEEEIKEETTIGTDKFGRPITTTKVRRPSSTELKEQKEKEEAETAQAM